MEGEDPESRGHMEAGENYISVGYLESICKGVQVPDLPLQDHMLLTSK